MEITVLDCACSLFDCVLQIVSSLRAGTGVYLPLNPVPSVETDTVVRSIW